MLLAAAVSAQSQSLGASAPEEIDSGLRSRVEAFYTHFQKGEFRQAETFLEEESKDAFYGAKKDRILGFEVKTIKWADDFRSANVLVLCQTIVPFLGSRPVAVPLAGDWRFQDDDWFMHLEIKDSEKDSGELLSHAPSPFGPMQFNQNVAAPGQYKAAPEAPRPTVESLAKMYQVSTQMVRFPPKPDEPVTRSILVKNNSMGKLQLERYGREIDGIAISITKPEFNAGEETEIQLTYDPKSMELAGRYRIDFMLMPISQMFEVFIDF
jgi:hypothetical protein